MRNKILLFLLAFTFLFSGLALAAGKKAPVRKKTTGISEASVSAAVDEFVLALNSLEDARVLASLAASDRGSLEGRENLIGLVYPRKLSNPKVTSFEKVEVGGKTLGANAKVTVDETDPIENLTTSTEHTWFLALDGSQLKVSLSSVWLDADMVRER